ncbi:translation elongation factor Ts (EF-Ts) [Desulfuromusa kysingii]|uniref:Elongation factor Ts n=1 Tax=Desulfuromusa kysingii TaxID=37625 RepID=A0A1H3Y8Z2_9BACT|nr:translation elongation factor Ts [Desulfuromusa kysingii]SEA07471.1 translation elongation factor Ts (EF-Ts) [Desulfuromusa kysingii]
MSITAAMVSELRKKTGAGMMDCKKALTETGGNMDEAVDFLRKKGLSAAAKKSGRIASEGAVVATAEGSVGAIVEVNAETDFVAKNVAFKTFVADVCDIVRAIDIADVEALKAAAYPGTGRTVAEELTHQIATIGENMSIRRLARADAGQGIVTSYVHGAGKIGVLVELQTASTDEKVVDLGKKLAMHVAAAAPQYLDRDSVPADVVAKEKEIMRVKALDSGKPEKIVEKIILGQINKYFGEVCLMEQAFVMDPDQKVGKLVAALSKELGSEIKLNSYVRYQLGEGIEKKEDDFAAEVAAMSKQ